MRILGINTGNGILVYPMRKYLVANYEPRSVFKTPNNIQWKLNFGNIPLFNNQSDFYNHVAKDYINNVDSIVSAPDCGHSSMLAYSRAKKLSNPKKNFSFNLFMDSIRMCMPKVFLMENLPKVLDMVPIEVWEKSFPGYELIFHILPVTEWGNSQKNRKRLVLIGLKKDAFGNNLSKVQYHFNNVYKIKKIKTCGILSIGLDEEDWDIGHIREDIDDVITMYSGFKISLKKVQQFWLNNPTLKRWPVNDKKFTTAPGVYRNLADDFPAVARKANRQFNDRGLQMSPRELARIQGIPNTFKIYTDLNRKTFSINKGRATVSKTPPYEIGRWFYKQLLKIKPWIS